MAEPGIVSKQQDFNAESYPPTILVVDDEPAVCDVIRNFLDTLGYRIIACNEPHHALDLLKRESIDMVLTDLQMGEISGVDVLRAAQRYQPDVVVVLITGYPTVETAVQVLKEGAYDYITKPFRLEELGKIVQRGLEKQRLAREVVLLRESLSLYQISEAMNSSLELPQVLQMILDSAVDEVQAENGCIVLVDERNERLMIGATRGELPQRSDQVEKFDLNSMRKWLKFHNEFRHPLQLGGEENGLAADCREFQKALACGCPLCPPVGWNATSLCMPLRAKDRVIGVLYVSRPYQTRRYAARDVKALAILASSAARAIENAQLYYDLHNDYLKTIWALANAVEAKDPYTRGHSDRVVRYTQAIGSAFDLPVTDLERLEVASILHDIGKIGISDQILLKPDSLTDEEFVAVRQHPVIGDRILQPIESLREVRRWIYHHHERFDGLGYPEGIRGDEIEFQARILIVAEVFDALVTERAYKKAWPVTTVVEYLQDHSGTHFDPEVIRAFRDILLRRGDEFAEFSRSGCFRILSPDDLVQFFKDAS